MGRKPLPSNVKRFKGTNRADRDNKNEAKPPPKIPEPPDHLSKLALIEWGRVSNLLLKLGLMSDLDMSCLAAYCQAYSRWAEAEELLKTEKLVIETKSGNIIQNPLVGIANKSMERMIKCLVEFGMSPSSRSKVVAYLPKDKKDDWDEFGT